MPSSPECAVATWYPADSSNSRRTLSAVGSSSMHNIVAVLVAGTLL
jgi:hypothetical protein